MSTSVAGIIKKDNRFLLGKRKPGGSIGDKWEFPGGKVKNGEDHKNALKREFLEELEIDILVEEFISENNFVSSDHNFTLYAYYVKPLSYDYCHNEHVEFRWFTKQEIIALADDLASSDTLILKDL